MLSQASQPFLNTLLPLLCPLPGRWLAPEVLQGRGATPASDVYSYGVILWELATFQLPFGSGVNAWQVGAYMDGGKGP